MNGRISPEERLRIDELRADRYARGTREIYDGAWRTFCRWLEARGVPTEMPVSPELVAFFAVECSDGYALASVENSLKGIAYMHRGGGYPPPTNDVIVRDVVAGLRRIKDVRQKQARPLYAADIDKIIRTACNPRPSSRKGQSENGYEKGYVAERRGRIEIATVLAMRDGLLRVSEARDLRWKDVSWSDDGSGTVCIRHAKGDQKGEGAVQWLSPRTMRALEAIKPKDAQETDRVFGTKHRQTIYDRIHRAAIAAGLGDGYSGHSPRVGMIYDMVAADVSSTAITQAARWKNPAMLVRYTRYLETARGAVAQLYAGRPLVMRRVRRWRPPVVVRCPDGPEPYP